MEQAASATELGRYGRAVGLAAVGCLATTLAFADHAPGWVFPHSRGAPIIVEGVEVSGAVIEEDWGLYRAGHGTVTIYPGVPLLAPPAVGYFPATGRRPRGGRYEIESPNDRIPRSAQPYFRRWTTDNVGEAVTPYPPPDPPEVIEAAPRERFRRRPPRRDR